MLADATLIQLNFALQRLYRAKVKVVWIYVFGRAESIRIEYCFQNFVTIMVDLLAFFPRRKMLSARIERQWIFKCKKD